VTVTTQVPAGAEFPALGGTAVVLATVPERLGQALALVRAEVAAIDAACSRFRADSELTGVNDAAGEWVTVSEVFGEALDTALHAAAVTDGDVDPTCGAALAAAGYDRDFAQIRAAGVVISVIGTASAPGWQAVEWDRDHRRVRIPAGSRLDFGATAKALAADRAARRSQAAVGGGVLVSLSGDISLAGQAPDGGWRVRVTDDHRAGDDAPGQTITLAEGGLATSTTTVRRWRVGSAAAHHLIDPGTGRPAASCWRTVSVAAASCVDANTASTAAMVRGTPAPRWLTGLRLPARLVREDGTIVTVAGWPRETADSQAA
jgi:thiamine biosynthesis lipoprotein